MTSQNQYQDDLMHRMMTAEEKPLSKTTKRDGSAEEDSQVAADHHDHGASEPIQEIENTTSHEHGHREILSDLQGESQIASDHHDHGASEPVPEIETTNFEHGHREIRSDLQGESPVVAAHDHHGASELIQGVDIANTEHHHREIAPAVQADSDIVVAAETMRAPEVYPITEQRDRLYGQAPTTSEHSQSPAPHLNTEISLDAVGRLSPSTSVEHRVGFQQERDAGIVIATETMVAPELYPIAEQQDRPYAYGTAPTTSEHSQVPVPHSSNATSLQAVGHLSSSTSVEHQVHFHQDRNAGIVIAAETIRAPELYPITEQQDHPYAYGTAPTTSEHSQVPVPHSSTATSLQAVGQSSSSTSVEHPVRSHQDRNAGIVVTAETTRAPELYSIAEQQDHPFGPALTASEHAQGPVPYLNTAVSLEAIGRSSSSINFEHQARLQQDYLEQDRLQQEALQQAHPHQAAFTTSEHPQGTEARLTTSTSPHIVGRSLSRRVSNASSSDVDDEQEIPVSFNPEVAHTLAPHLQENLRSIEHESQQKAIAKAERNARVASGNSFSHFNAASGPPAQQVPSSDADKEPASEDLRQDLRRLALHSHAPTESERAAARALGAKPAKEVAAKDVQAPKKSAPKKSALRALLEQVKKGWKKAFGGRQRSRSPLRPLRHEDRYPPPRRGPMYSTMPSAGGSPERSALDNQRWDPALKGAAGGALQRGGRERWEPEVPTGDKGAMTARARLEGY